MKIAFSTLGCPDWSWGETAAAAKDLGYDGVELRVVDGEIYLPKARIFVPDRLGETRASLARRGLALPCLSSSCYLHLADHRSERLQEGRDYVALAAALGAPYVRVLGDMEPHPTGGVDDGFVAEGLRALGEAAAGQGVMVLIETNGAYANSQRLRRLIERVGLPSVGVLWDVHHTFRYGGEIFARTWGELGGLVRYLHLKDSVRVGDRVRYMFFGEGDLPLAELASVLRDGGYDGWASLEWVKKWQSDLEEPGVVFPHFIGAAREIFG